MIVWEDLLDTDNRIVHIKRHIHATHMNCNPVSLEVRYMEEVFEILNAEGT